MAGTSKNDDIDFKWGRKKRVGVEKRDVQFYESFYLDGVEYNLYDCVYLYKAGEPEPYIGKLIKIWENPNKSRKVKVLWFFRPCEIVNYLGTEELLENELFLASGKGDGLANINPLEAIAGKCCVICISKDTRNLQPSHAELQMADFVFSRTFDVAQCKIMNKIDEKIAGIEVKFMFNSVGSLNRIGVEKVVSIDNKDEDLGKSALPCEALPSGSGMLEGKKDSKDEEPSLDTKSNGHTCEDHVLVKAKSPRHKTTPTFEVDSEHMSKLENCRDMMVELEATVKPLVQSDDLNRPLKKRKLDASEMSLSNKHKNDEGKSTDGFGVSREASIQCGSASRNQLKNKFFNESPRGDKGLIRKPEQKLMELSSGKSREVSSHQSPEKCPLVNESPRGERGLIRKPEQKLMELSSGKSREVSSHQFPEKCPLVNESPRGERGLNRMPEQKSVELSSGKSCEVSSQQSPEKHGKINHKALQAPLPIDVDKNTWFKEPPFEERMQTACEQGKLVLLRNLDPTYVSTEVEDIIWQGLNERCSAKMLSQTTNSSPHYGQAFVIFKTKEAAKSAIKKLDTRCLVLPDGRPLVGCVETPCFPGKQSAFNGHIAFSNTRQPQARVMKEAVSTSHCSQPNTIAYDMALEWCLLQQRSDFVWDKFNEIQGVELAKVKAHLKSR